MVVPVLAPSRTRVAAPGKGHHTPALLAPWFAAAGEGCTLHRYLDDQFVPRFIQDAQAGRLAGTRAQGWYQADQVGRFRDFPLLRLPMHGAFYLASCELACDTFGHPAYDPARVKSAGLVVRRGLPGGKLQLWMQREGEAIGWVDGEHTGAEPDEYRRLILRRLIQPRVPEPPYSGEETYPMHPLLVRVRDGAGATRNRTVLWGYVPLGGNARQSGDVSVPADTDTALKAELSWPFGSRAARAWIKTDHRPVLDGHATQAFYEVLEVLLRYRVNDATDPDNEALRSLLDEIHFYPRPAYHPLHPYDRHGSPDFNQRGSSLLAWLDSSAGAILDWLLPITSGRLGVSAQALPWVVGYAADGQPISVPTTLDLYLTSDQAALLRDLIAARGRRGMARNEDGIAMPRFPQGEDDIFHTRPFVRWVDDCGCEKITWGPPSLPFRVSSPLDPDFQRPQAIILPRLDDLKRGAARGIALLAPKSLADKLRKISPEMPPAEGGPGNRCGLCWVISLSIPVVTICAMIILMILINLLNLIFGWLPWAILALPRLCGKLLKE